MKNNNAIMSIVITLITTFSVVAVNATEGGFQRSVQMKMLERHQDERQQLRETHRAELAEIRELHRKELDLLLNRQKEERNADRSRRLGI